MGLFDFLRDAGDKDATKTVEVSPERLDELRQQNITKKLAQLGVGGEPVTVEVKGDTAILTGRSPDQETLEKMVLCAGNQFGIGHVDCRIEIDSAPVSAAQGASADNAAESAAKPAGPSTFYTVKAGDTLSKIAAAHYGSANKYPIIFEANRPMLSDPDKIYPGQSLRIPPL